MSRAFRAFRGFRGSGGLGVRVLGLGLFAVALDQSLVFKHYQSAAELLFPANPRALNMHIHHVNPQLGSLNPQC